MEETFICQTPVFKFWVLLNKMIIKVREKYKISAQYFYKSSSQAMGCEYLKTADFGNKKPIMVDLSHKHL